MILHFLDVLIQGVSGSSASKSDDLTNSMRRLFYGQKKQMEKQKKQFIFRESKGQSCRTSGGQKAEYPDKMEKEAQCQK